MTTSRDQQTSNCRDALLTIASVGVILMLLRLSASIVEPILLSLLIVSIAIPGVKALRRVGISTGVSVVVGLFVIVVLLSGFSVLFSGVLANFLEDLPRYQELLHAHSVTIDEWFAGHGIDLHKGGVLHHFSPERLTSLVESTVTHLGSALSDMLLILFIVIFMLAEAAHFPQKMAMIMGEGGSEARAMTKLLEDVKLYAATKALVSLVTGFLIWAGLRALGLEYAELWGALAFLLNFIPNLGSILAAIPAVMLATLHGSFLYVVAVIALYAGVNIVIGNIVEPIFLGRRVGLSAVTILLSLVFWGWMFGIVGMLVSVPISMAVRTFAESYPPTRWLAIMMGPNVSSEATDTTKNQ